MKMPMNGMILCKKESTKQKTKEIKKMKTRGWYTFTDGYTAWFSGLTGNEKKVEIRKHGKIVKFEQTA